MIPCPVCKSPSLFAPANRWRPFCSQRCKVIDLGAWASDAYRIEGSSRDPLDPDGAAPDTPPDAENG